MAVMRRRMSKDQAIVPVEACVEVVRWMADTLVPGKGYLEGEKLEQRERRT